MMHESIAKEAIRRTIALVLCTGLVTPLAVTADSFQVSAELPDLSRTPVLDIEDSNKLAPYLRASAGKFDPDARPNAALRSLIASKQVVQYSQKGLGGGIFVIGQAR